jgi:hypothetical protein
LGKVAVVTVNWEDVLVSRTVAVPFFVESARLVAVTVSVPLVGTVTGAV